MADGFTDLWASIKANVFPVITGIYYIVVFVLIIRMILKRRDPVKTTAWSVVLIFLPVFGLVFYVFFGQNYRKDKIFSRKGLEDLKYIEDISRSQLTKIKRNTLFSDNLALLEYKNIITLLLNNSKAVLTQYNSIDVYGHGKQTFAAIKEALRKAKKTIHLQFYIIESEGIGNEIKEILLQKAAEGVEVRVMYDDVGSWSLSKKYIKDLQRGGVKIFPFMKVRFPILSSKLNYRNHRKILVIDGKVGFMGGINIADRYITGGKKFSYWRDTHLKIEGEAVYTLQLIFLVDWYFVSGEMLIHLQPKIFPNSHVKEKCCVQITSSGPDSDWASIMQAFFAAFTHAKDHIYITTPYFTPNESILTALKTAALSGVDVRLILPAKSDSSIVYYSTLSYLSELLDAGVKVFLYQKGFIHAKVILVDGTFASVGSANLDVRSFEHNFEVMAFIYDREVTLKLENQFRTDIRNSKLVHSSSWEKRSFWFIVKESFARLFSPLL